MFVALFLCIWPLVFIRILNYQIKTNLYFSKSVPFKTTLSPFREVALTPGSLSFYSRFKNNGQTFVLNFAAVKNSKGSSLVFTHTCGM